MCKESLYQMGIQYIINFHNYAFFVEKSQNLWQVENGVVLDFSLLKWCEEHADKILVIHYSVFFCLKLQIY